MENLLEEFNNLSNDKEKWLWVKDHQDSGVVVFLDNDDTFIAFDDVDGTGQFREYLGWSDGIFDLLDVFGIKCEGV